MLLIMGDRGAPDHPVMRTRPLSSFWPIPGCPRWATTRCGVWATA